MWLGLPAARDLIGRIKDPDSHVKEPMTSSRKPSKIPSKDGQEILTCHNLLFSHKWEGYYSSTERFGGSLGLGSDR